MTFQLYWCFEFHLVIIFVYLWLHTQLKYIYCTFNLRHNYVLTCYLPLASNGFLKKKFLVFKAKFLGFSFSKIISTIDINYHSVTLFYVASSFSFPLPT